MRDQYIKQRKDRRDKKSEVPAWFRRSLNRTLRAKMTQAMRECRDFDNEVLPTKTNNVYWLWT